MFTAPSVGDHVRLREPHRRLLGTDVKRNELAIVRATHLGLLSSEATVELANGTRTIRVPLRKLRRTGGHGEGGGFGLARDWHRAKTFAGLILFVPVAVALGRYFLAGGTPVGLVMPLIEGVLDTTLRLLTGPLGGFVIAVAVVLWIRARISKR